MRRPAADASAEHRIFGVAFYSFLYRRIVAVRVPTTYLHTITTAVLLVYGNSIMIFRYARAYGDYTNICERDRCDDDDDDDDEDDHYDDNGDGDFDDDDDYI